MSNNEEALMKRFKAETGKNAIWRGKITQGYLKWKQNLNKKQKRKKSSRSTSFSLKDKNLQNSSTQISSTLVKFEKRLTRLEKAVFKSKMERQDTEISEDHLLHIIKTVYRSEEKKMGNFISIPVLTEKLKKEIPWTTQQIHNELYKLFMDYKIDLQPGKLKMGQPLQQDGKTFVWFALK